jgi:uncharacterized membrane protein YjjP (DUF1212 family)
MSVMAKYYLTDQAAEQHTSSTDYANEFLFNALNIGEAMLVSGAEVSSVEECMYRICRAYGAEKVDVFTITSAIIVTAYSPMFGTVTQTRRITFTQYDLRKLARLNSLANRICEEMPLFKEVESELDAIRFDTPGYSFRSMLGIYALISASFTLFFGGSYRDACAGAVIGIFLKYMESISRQFQLPDTVTAVLWSFAGGSLAILVVAIGAGDAADKISIGNIMLLIPGLQLTNSMRDIFSGDTLSALLRFCNACVLAMLIAFGFALPAHLW